MLEAAARKSLALSARVGDRLGAIARVVLVGRPVEDLAVLRAALGGAPLHHQLGLTLLDGIGLRLGRSALGEYAQR